MHSPDEVLLRDAFRDLRGNELAAAPRFDGAPASGGEGDRTQSVLHWCAAALLIIGIILPFAFLLRVSPQATVDLSWKAPTDFLLQTPQADLLRNVPQFGERKTGQ